MNKQQKLVIGGGVAVAVILVALIVILVINYSQQSQQSDSAEARLDSLQIVNDQLRLTNEFNQLNADFSQYEDQQVYLKNDSLVQQYNAARMKVEGLLKELEQEKRKNSNTSAQLAASRRRISELQNEIVALKGIVKHYLAEIQRLGEENSNLKKEIQAVQEQNSALSNQVTAANASNAQLNQTVQLAKKLNITGVKLRAYNKKGKEEKNITKARQLGVSFSVYANATAAPGMKDFYVRILTPEGALLGGGSSFKIDGANVAASSHRRVEYANDEINVAIYTDVNTTLTAGDYTVEVFCDGYRLYSHHFPMKK